MNVCEMNEETSDYVSNDGSSTTDEQVGEDCDFMEVENEHECKLTETPRLKSKFFDKMYRSIALKFNKVQRRTRLAYCLMEICDVESGNTFADLLSEFKNNRDYLLSRATKKGGGKVLLNVCSLEEDPNLLFESRFRDVHQWNVLLELSDELKSTKRKCELFHSSHHIDSNDLVNPDLTSVLEVK